MIDVMNKRKPRSERTEEFALKEVSNKNDALGMGGKKTSIHSSNIHSSRAEEKVH